MLKVNDHLTLLCAIGFLFTTEIVRLLYLAITEERDCEEIDIVISISFIHIENVVWQDFICSENLHFLFNCLFHFSLYFVLCLQKVSFPALIEFAQSQVYTKIKFTFRFWRHFFYLSLLDFLLRIWTKLHENIDRYG